MRNNTGQFKKGHKPINPFRKGLVPWNKGKKHSKEVRAKMVKNHKGNTGKKFSKEHIERIQSAKAGYRHSAETKRKISSSRAGKRSGKDCHLWRGGITPINFQIRNSFKYRQWRSDVFTRDDFTCQNCSERGVYLEADHFPKMFSEIIRDYKIKSFEEALDCSELWNLNNGRTLCKECHKKIGKRR